MFKRSEIIGMTAAMIIAAGCQQQPQLSLSETLQKHGDDSSQAVLNSKLSLPEKMTSIKSGTYIPLYGNDNQSVHVNAFQIDVYPVTNKEFALFVKANPQWRRSMIKSLFADKNYLYTWENDTMPGKEHLEDAPVTNVSWFAANAYCKCREARLPTIDEWEYVAMAGTNEPDARKNLSHNQYILDWYEKPSTYKNKVGGTYKNYWGVYDMHGLVWEWTSDFNSVLISGENRGDTGSDTDLFCGSGSLGANDLMNYAAFMRYAFRGSMESDYAVRNLGFRCAKNKTSKAESSSPAVITSGK